MKPREYCCCAIPLVNAGVFSVLVEQLVASVIAGTLAIATPSSMSFIHVPEHPFTAYPTVVGAATPSFAKWIFAIVCYVAAAIQVFGFMGVAQVSTIHKVRSKELAFIVYSRKRPFSIDATLLCTSWLPWQCLPLPQLGLLSLRLAIQLQQQLVSVLSSPMQLSTAPTRPKGILCVIYSHG